MKKLLRGFTKVLTLLIPDLEWLIIFRNENKKAIRKESIKDRFWAFRNGFYVETVKLCKINKNNVHEYLSDKSYLRLHPINREYSKIIDNKLYLPFLLKDYPELVPQYYYVIDRGRSIILDSNLSPSKDLLQLCKEKHILTLKPCSATMGEGFYRLEWRNDSFLLNNKQIEISELHSFIKSLDNYLVTEYICQHKYAAEINQDSVNTIRLICARDGINNQFFIPVSFHRFGTKGRFVDNIGANGGAIASYIDIPTGMIKDLGLIKEKGKVERIENIIKHPDSQMQISDTIIPHWSETIEKVLVLLNHLSFLKYMGMDIVITENGFKIFEMNSLPTLHGLQVEKGIFKAERLKLFFNGQK